MIAVIDPALFLTEQATGPLSAAEEQALTSVVDDAVRVCRTQQAVIPAADWYWAEIQRELVRPLHARIREPRLRQGLDELRRYTKPMPLPERPAEGKTRMWSVKPLFAWKRLDARWLGIMERVLVGCAQQQEQPLLLITRLFPERNMRLSAVGSCTLAEKTRWQLYVHVPGHPPRHVHCVRNPRNLEVPWTTRFDDKLPDRGRFPFCPPKRWSRRDTEACRTVESKPAWIDRDGSAWIQPATGGDNQRGQPLGCLPRRSQPRSGGRGGPDQRGDVGDPGEEQDPGRLAPRAHKEGLPREPRRIVDLPA